MYHRQFEWGFARRARKIRRGGFLSSTAQLAQLTRSEGQCRCC